jgi:hypothetical protein
VADVDEHITFLEDGWVLWNRSRPGTTEGLTVYAQLFAEDEASRGELINFVVCGRNLEKTDPAATDVTTDQVRSVPVAHIQRLATANPDFEPHVNGTPFRPISEAFNQFRIHANRIMLANAERKARGEPEPPKPPRKPLTRPDGNDPGAFYRQVADAYRDALRTTDKVAVVLAEEAQVPVGTVHRWVLEARRRGFLPPARQGRAG